MQLLLAQTNSAETPSISCVSIMALFGLSCWLVYLLLQRTGEFVVGRRRTSIREVMFYTAVIAGLCLIFSYLNAIRTRH